MPVAAKVLEPVPVVHTGVPPAAGTVVFAHTGTPGVKPVPNSGVSVKP